jgi:diguanylate cyclase (GGDEF)-like protein
MTNADYLLIVDDSPEVIQMLHLVMGDLCECAFATRGEAAIELACKRQPSVILLDVEMPGMDGFEVLARLKANSATAQIPVIFVTGSAGSAAEVAAIEAGAADFITKPIVAPVARARVALQLKLHRQARELAHLASHDGLTGLYNRRHFDQVLEEEVARHFRNRESLAVAMIDVDFFKAYNDRYGHPEGDACLRTIAQALERCAQRAGDLVARYGGEEFAVVLPRVGSDQARALGEKLCEAVRAERIVHAGAAGGIATVSVGIAAGVPRRNDPTACLERADRAVYAVKHRGRDGWELGEDLGEL